MSTYTNNLNLIKPGYNDDIDVAQLNNNMDVLDTQVYNVITVNDNQNRRLTDLENKAYPYLPLTGGTVTGDLNVDGTLLVGGAAPQYEIERKVDDSNENYTLQSIKYSNGVLEQVVRMKKFTGINEQVTFLIPFANVNDISLSNGSYSLATDEYKEPYNDWVWSVANLSTTGAKFKASGYYSRPCYIVRGYWK